MEEQLFPQPAQSAKPAAPPAAPSQQITSIATRLKLAEERYANLSKRNQITEESLLSFERDIKAELRVLTKQTVELRKRLSEMNAKLDAMVGELGSVVQKHEFSTVERYLDLWQPMQFISREEAKRLMAQAIAESAQATPREDPDA
jgi:hypothetical protein